MAGKAFSCVSVHFLPQLEMLRLGPASCREAAAPKEWHCLLAAVPVSWQLFPWPCHVLPELLDVHGPICGHRAAIQCLVCY